MNRWRLTRWLVRGTLVFVALCASSFWGWRHAIDNFGVVLEPGSTEAGAVYRSDQMEPDQLFETVKSLGIKTVLNLRGPNPREGWYDKERETTLQAGATQVDIALSSCEWMSRDQALVLANALLNEPRPILVHCYHGSERTGLASAMVQLLTPGRTVAEASQAFSWKYMFFGLGDGVATLHQFNAYEDWLKREKKTHSPEIFLLWLKNDFQPKWPSREQWPYDPYPLVIRSQMANDNMILSKGSKQTETIRQ